MSEYSQPPHTPMPPSYQEVPGATAGLVLGILSIVFSGPIVGLTLGIIGFIKAREAKRLVDANPGVYTNAGVAQGGYICSIIGIVLGGITTLCGCGYFIVVAAALFGAAAGGSGL